ncbi:MAG: class II aldolase/adducin family protein [Deltaproteobacteria bacterium]|nr:MAG: class II aldolase/adducin family protein [Deltaproteobacteria bacterium]
MDIKQKLKEDIVCISRMLHRKNYLAATDGNVSVRQGDLVFVTPSGVNKGLMESYQVLTVDLEGKLLGGEGKPTSEIRMHLLAYQLRPDVQAVVHAHLPYATACTLAGIDLLEPILPEVVITLGGIPTAPYATPSTEEVPESVRPFVKEYDAILLSRHGAMTMGKDVTDAYNKMEKLEHTARVVLAARLQGPLPPLPEAEVEKLRRLREEYKRGGS